ncbi:cyclic GMP-AMP synthase-like receptor isoform X2 [Choristoneura fumiferana]|uniref:cyclic GMP-AMP synthase-like receptor isoform X2 n=1 Tax=Choristoneura fumiferana TaxID=7141 RepID=UPI003D15C5B3
MSVNKKYMDLYLTEIYKNFVAIKDDDYKKSQEVFKGVFDQVKQKMGENCKYFGKYSNQVLFAGSVYDGIKVSKLDEFDMDIVIRLPINYEHGENGIILENDEPGFVKMKIINSFDNLDKQPEWEDRHKVTRDWRDSDKYFLQNKFRAWMHSIVQKAVNDMKGEVTVNGDLYLLKYKMSGPAFTLNVRNSEGRPPFNLDVDLVPVIRFSHPRWPQGYKQVDGMQSRDWLVVPKPAKGMPETQQNRCWRLSFQDFERDLMKGCQQLKITIRLVKKLRDALGLKAIASYYIKTLFLWKIEKENDRKYWQNKISLLFQTMVEELHEAIVKKNIPYYWNPSNNLIETLKPTLQTLYADRLLEVISSLKAGDIERSVAYLLNAEELAQYKESEFYKHHLNLLANASLKQQVSVQSDKHPFAFALSRRLAIRSKL